ncbi:MAG: recombination mediator RecR [Clostridia bacterium]
MDNFAPSIEDLIEQFAKLPGIGAKTAQRLTFHVLNMEMDDVKKFSDALINAKEKIKLCKNCQNLTSEEICEICRDKTRDESTICVVSDPKDIVTFEKTREYKGLYHILHGTISPIANIGPDDIKIKELLHRCAEQEIKEIIVATNPDTNGEATAMYIKRLLKPFEIKVTRLAFGIPVGGNLEYVDEVTLMRALDGRREI